MQSLPKLAGDRVHVHYQVKSVQEFDHEKELHLEGSYTGEQVVVHLRDCWFDTSVEPGHSVNLLAEKVLEGDGVLHAVCNFQAGRPVIPTCLVAAASILLLLNQDCHASGCSLQHVLFMQAWQFGSLMLTYFSRTQGLAV